MPLLAISCNQESKANRNLIAFLIYQSLTSVAPHCSAKALPLAAKHLVIAPFYSEKLVKLLCTRRRLKPSKTWSEEGRIDLQYLFAHPLHPRFSLLCPVRACWCCSYHCYCPCLAFPLQLLAKDWKLIGNIFALTTIGDSFSRNSILAKANDIALGPFGCCCSCCWCWSFVWLADISSRESWGNGLWYTIGRRRCLRARTLFQS